MPCSDPGEHVLLEAEFQNQPTSAIHTLLHLSICRDGETIALESASRLITYSALDNITTRLAGYLNCLGVNSGDIVATLLPKSHLPPVCHLAILKLGGTVVSLDPSHPPSRYHEILQQLPPATILARKESLHIFQSSKYRVVEVSDYLFDILPETNFSVDTTQSPSSTAWITTTSGSTGIPKLIALSHSALTCAFSTHAAFLDLNSSDRLLHFCSPSFDVSIAEVFLALAAQATLVIPTDNDRMNHLGDFIRTRRVSHAVLTPSVARVLSPDELPGLHTLVLTGECMGPRDVEMWAHRLQLINLYGPAEASVWATGRRVKSGSNPKNVGRGLWSALDIVELEGTKSVGVGVVGELILCGPGVARYLGEKAGGFVETWKTFGRGFRTGDLAKWTEDGQVIVLGRFGSVVKVRGQRLDVGEVEGAIMKAAPNEVAVLVPLSGPCEGRLIAVMETGTRGGAIALDDNDIANHDSISYLRHVISERLPVYMVPSLWNPVTSLPLTASGKLDRKLTTKWVSSMSPELYKRILSINVGENDAVGPICSIELKLREIWASALGIGTEEVGNASFLRLGGDSITAMQVICRCRTEGIAVTVDDIISAKNTADLGQKSRSVKRTKAIIAKTVDEDRLFPLSSIQSLWLDIAPSGPKNYTQSFLFEIQDPQPPALLQNAVQCLLNRHEMLRARFQPTPRGWMQFVSSELQSSLRICFHQVDSLEEIPAVTRETQNTALDIRRGPIIAFDVFEIARARQVMFATAHHLIIDLVSWRVVLGDLSDLLQRKALPSPPPHFCNWVQQKSHRPVITRPDRLSYGQSQVHTVTLSSMASSKIINHADHSETLILIIASLFYSHASASSQRLLTIFNESHGRHIGAPGIEPDTSSTVGWFTTIGAISPQVTRDSSFLDTLDAVRSCKLSATREDKMDQNMSVLFNFRGGAQALPKGLSLIPEMGLQPTEEGAPDVPRLAETEIEGVITRDGRLELIWTYPSGREEVGVWAKHCGQLLENLADVDTAMFQRPLERRVGDTIHKRLLPLLNISENDVERVFPVNNATQLRILQAQLQFPETPEMYHPLQRWTIKPAPHPREVLNAWSTLVKAHDILRTTFQQVDGIWYGIIRSVESIPDLSTTSSMTVESTDDDSATLSLYLSHAQIDGYSTDYLLQQLLHILSSPTDSITTSSHSTYFSDPPNTAGNSIPAVLLTPTLPPGRWLNVSLTLPSLAAITAAAVETRLTVASVIRGIWCLSMTLVAGPRGSTEYFVSTRTPELAHVVGPMLETRGCEIILGDGLGVREIAHSLKDRNTTSEHVGPGARIRSLVNYRRKQPTSYGEWEVKEHWCHDPMLYHMVCEVLQDERGLVGKIGYWENWVGENILAGMVEEVRLGLERFVENK